MGCKPSTARQDHTKITSDVTLGASHVESPPSKEPKFEDDYNLGKELGRGAFSVVFDGTKKQTGANASEEQFAVKVVKRAKLDHDDEVALQDEIAILQELDHPNIIHLVDVFYDHQRHYLVMEKVAGGELFDRIVQKSYYNEKEARDTCVTLLRAIQYCHSKQVAHRDLKPQNLLLLSTQNDTDIKLADFGFAKSCPNDHSLRTQCGTPGYVAPEILEGVAYGTKSDLWSLGVIMYILLGGYPPFTGKDNREMFRKIRKGQYKFHEDYWSDVSTQAKDLIRSLLILNPTQRMSASQALEAPWVQRLTDDQLLSQDLSLQLEQFKENFDPRRKLKGTVHAVMLTKHLNDKQSTTPSAPLVHKKIQKLASLGTDLGEQLAD